MCCPLVLASSLSQQAIDILLEKFKSVALGTVIYPVVLKSIPSFTIAGTFTSVPESVPSWSPVTSSPVRSSRVHLAMKSETGPSPELLLLDSELRLLELLDTSAGELEDSDDAEEAEEGEELELEMPPEELSEDAEDNELELSLLALDAELCELPLIELAEDSLLEELAELAELEEELELEAELAELGELLLELALDGELLELDSEEKLLLLELDLRGELEELEAEEKLDEEELELDAPGPSLTTSYHSCLKLIMLLSARLVILNRYSLPPPRISSCPLSCAPLVLF